ncbi:L-2-haloalkanoic acid dehalogenase [Virgibacillus phasianinus]|uniref:L-2-haloalkanoic acid dehalogenase n=1 Tax=Virgibacillus phasianinus TaxID=2017483 RepID=A0A220U6J6_9BACI|nr:HAD family hydrolase [Virgibacillus phasianinus]ASK63747.1 L-2-haloalkanoic acid dehalogenase [Virgibacillus phasianinus]
MIKAVIFDLDGTLLNRDSSVQRFIENQYDRLNKWLGHISKSAYTARFIELDCRGYVWKDEVYRQLVKEFNVKGITWKSLLKDYMKEFSYNCVPFPNLARMLKAIQNKSIRIGLITNGRGQFQMDNIEALGIGKYFDKILISEWEGIKKPNPDIFIRALNQLHVSPNEAMYVGDHPDNDIKAARSIGMTGVWKGNPYWNSVDADFVINDLIELSLLIRMSP